jgi:hypothetical protein
MGPSWCEQVERILDGTRIGQKQRSLTEIVKHQSGKNDGEPAEPDWQAAEMAHIRIHRLRPGEREEGGAEHGETDTRLHMN